MDLSRIMRMLAVSVVAMVAVALVGKAHASNQVYHDTIPTVNPAGAPQVGNWAWVLRSHNGQRQHVWWMKHHWTTQANLANLNNGAEVEMEFFNGGDKEKCDIFNITDGIHMNAPGFEAHRPRNGCDNRSIREEVIIEVQDKTKVPLATANQGPSWAAVAVISYPENTETTSEVNMEWERGIFNFAWKGKINLTRCTSPILFYKVSGDDPADITKPNSTTSCG